MKKGMCTKGRAVYGIVTVSDKGQIAIPVDARSELKIREGDKLLVLRRKDGCGIELLKMAAAEKLFSKMQEG